jgi:hypothetical protein
MEASLAQSFRSRYLAFRIRYFLWSEHHEIISPILVLAGAKRQTGSVFQGTHEERRDDCLFPPKPSFGRENGNEGLYHYAMWCIFILV